MTGLKLVILLGFGLMFAAGLAVGRAGLIAAKPSIPPPPLADTSYLAARLNLSPDQQKQMEEIWSRALATAPDMPARLHAIDVDCNAEVEKFLSSDQKIKFEQLEAARDAQITALRADRDKIMREAQDETRAILNPTQAATFDQIIKERGHFSPRMQYHPPTQP